MSKLLTNYLAIIIPERHRGFMVSLCEELESCTTSSVVGWWKGEAEHSFRVCKFFSLEDAEETEEAFSLAVRDLLLAGEEAVYIEGNNGVWIVDASVLEDDGARIFVGH